MSPAPPRGPCGPFGKDESDHGSCLTQGSAGSFAAFTTPRASKAGLGAVGMKSLCGPLSLARLAPSEGSVAPRRHDATQSVSSWINVGLAHDRGRFPSRDMGTPMNRLPPLSAAGASSARAPERNFEPPGRRLLQASSSPASNQDCTPAPGSQPPGASTLTTGFCLARSAEGSPGIPRSNSSRTRPRSASRLVARSSDFGVGQSCSRCRQQNQVPHSPHSFAFTLSPHTTQSLACAISQSTAS